MSANKNIILMQFISKNKQQKNYQSIKKIYCNNNKKMK